MQALRVVTARVLFVLSGSIHEGYTDPMLRARLLHQISQVCHDQLLNLSHRHARQKCDHYTIHSSLLNSLDLMSFHEICSKSWQQCLKLPIGRASLVRENEAGSSWGQKVHILHVNI